MRNTDGVIARRSALNVFYDSLLQPFNVYPTLEQTYDGSTPGLYWDQWLLWPITSDEFIWIICTHLAWQQRSKDQYERNHEIHTPSGTINQAELLSIMAAVTPATEALGLLKQHDSDLPVHRSDDRLFLPRRDGEELRLRLRESALYLWTGKRYRNYVPLVLAKHLSLLMSERDEVPNVATAQSVQTAANDRVASTCPERDLSGVNRRTSQARVNEWMRACYLKDFENKVAPPKRQSAFDLCRQETGARESQMRDAIREVPAKHRRKRGERDYPR